MATTATLNRSIGVLTIATLAAGLLGGALGASYRTGEFVQKAKTLDDRVTAIEAAEKGRGEQLARIETDVKWIRREIDKTNKSTP